MGNSPKLEGESLERKPRLQQGQRLKSGPKMRRKWSNTGTAGSGIGVFVSCLHSAMRAFFYGKRISRNGESSESRTVEYAAENAG